MRAERLSLLLWWTLGYGKSPRDLAFLNIISSYFTLEVDLFFFCPECIVGGHRSP